MAIYHASFQVIKRSAGRSSVAAAAYRSGEKLTDERTGSTHDYRRKGGVYSSFILAPDEAPSWATDRKQLWSNVELGEKRKDAQVARELNVALPRELSAEQSKHLVEVFISNTFVSEGMIADVALHDVDSDNPHAHIMFTMREVDENGFGEKNRDWNNKKNVSKWREEWADYVNTHLRFHKKEGHVDHRSLKDQGIDRVPTIHLGPKCSALEKGKPSGKNPRDPVRTIRGDHNREAEKVNNGMRLSDRDQLLADRKAAREEIQQMEEETKAEFVRYARDLTGAELQKIGDFAVEKYGEPVESVDDDMVLMALQMRADQGRAIESDSVDSGSEGSDGDGGGKIRARKAAPAPVRGGGGSRKSGMDLEMLKDELVGPEERKRRRAMQRRKGIDI